MLVKPLVTIRFLSQLVVWDNSSHVSIFTPRGDVKWMPVMASHHCEPGPHVSVSIRGDNTGGSASTIVTPRLWSFYKHIYLIFNSILSLSGIIIVPEKIFFPSYTHNEKWIQKNWACLEGDRKFKALVMLHRVTTPLAPSQATLHLLRDPGGEISSRPIKLLLCASLTDCSND